MTLQPRRATCYQHVWRCSRRIDPYLVEVAVLAIEPQPALTRREEAATLINNPRALTR